MTKMRHIYEFIKSTFGLNSIQKNTELESIISKPGTNRTQSSKRSSLLFSLMIGICAILSACGPDAKDESAIPEDKGPKWGFINHSGRFVIKPEFQRVSKFSEGLAAADKHNRWGYIDRTGKFVIERQYSYAKAFSSGYASVEMDSLWGLINKQGKLVMPYKYQEIGKPHEVDPDAEDHAVLVPCREEVTPGVPALWGFHDLGPHGHGNILPQWKKVKYFNDGLCPVWNEKKNKWGYINRTGQIVIDYKFDEASVFKNRIAECMMGDDFVWVDQIGTIAKKSRLESLQLFHDRVAVQPSRKKTFIYITREGKPAFKKRFHYADNFSEGLAVVQPVGMSKRGYIDVRGDLVIPPRYDDARAFSEQLGAVRIDPDEFFKTHNEDGSPKKGTEDEKMEKQLKEEGPPPSGSEPSKSEPDSANAVKDQEKPSGEKSEPEASESSKKSETGKQPNSTLEQKNATDGKGAKSSVDDDDDDDDDDDE